MSGCLGLFAPKVGQVSGNVAYSSGAPIEGATVQLGSVSATTDVQGNFAFRNVSH